MLEYKTIKRESSAEFIERKSRFIGYVKPVIAEEEAIDFINKIKSMHRRAKHNVYAYSISQNNISRFSDDGEPQGTAGIPILDCIKKLGLSNVCVVVTRYFGGILLGSGGLIRAYSHASKIAIESAEIITMKNSFFVEIICQYNQHDKIISLLTLEVGSVESVDFSDNVKIYFYVDIESFDAIKTKISEVTSGDVTFNILKEIFH